MEILNERINSTNSIKGFKLEGMDGEIKCIQHADDSTFPLKNTDFLEKTIDIIERETKLNLSKTDLYLVY